MLKDRIKAYLIMNGIDEPLQHLAEKGDVNVSTIFVYIRRLEKKNLDIKIIKWMIWEMEQVRQTIAVNPVQSYCENADIKL